MDTGIKKRIIAKILGRGVTLLQKSLDWHDFAQRNCYLEDRTTAFILIDDATEEPFARQDFGLINVDGRYELVKFNEPTEKPTVWMFCTESMFLRIALKKTNPAKGVPWTPQDAFWTTPYFYLHGENYFRDYKILDRLFQEVSGVVDDIEEEFG